jgi:4a-hydroxytetrahydrobiopterin dehydratase
MTAPAEPDLPVSRAEASAAVSHLGWRYYTDEAPAFRVLADADGNEACVTTWRGRDA